MNQSKTTTAFYAQSALSFAIALGGLVIGIIYLQVDPWVRAFLSVGALYLVTSAFTLAKCVRDQQENVSVISRLDQARLERLLAEFDPYQAPNLGPIGAPAPKSHHYGQPFEQTA
jgi:hypothetical protein